MRDPRFTLDVRELSGLLSRTAVGTPRRVLAASIALLVLMGALTGVFARAYHEAEERRAREQFHMGEAAATAGRAADAAEHYRASLALDRENPTYRRALAISLLSLRRTAEAETHLSQLLQRDPVDGEANLLLARLAASRGAFDDTEAFYQRAIYGRWADEPAARRLAARFELIEWLVQMGARAPARAELLRLQAELPDVPFLQRQLADRWLELDQPAQAATILARELARRADAGVAAALVKAEIAAGRFVEARHAARRALALDPRDRRTRERLLQITQVLALDPTQQGLSAAERFERSHRLLRRVRDDLQACLAAESGGSATTDGSAASAGAAAGGAMPSRPEDQATLAAVLANADALLANPQAPGPTPATPDRGDRAGGEQNRATASADATSAQAAAESVETRTDARLTAANALWTARVSRCGRSTDALAWIFDRLPR